MKRKIKYIILFLSFFLFIGLQIKQEIERNIIYNKVNNLKIKPTNEQINDYLEIPSINLKQLIIKGITVENLNKNFVTVNKKIEKNRNMILAGHSIKNVFGHLHKIRLNDEIYINNKYKYVVIKKKIIYENQYNELSQNEKEINLITCTLNNKKRLLVIAKQVD